MVAVMTVLFYSDGMRELLLNSLKTVTKNTDSIKQIKDIINEHFTHTNHEYMNALNTISPFNLLDNLHKDEPYIFEHDPKKESGYFAGRYLHKLMSYSGFNDYFILDALKTENKDTFKLLYGQYNKLQITKQNGIISKKYSKATSSEAESSLKKTPKVLIIITKKPADKKFYPSYYDTGIDYNFDEYLHYNGEQYKADSMIIANYNHKQCKGGHEISGITCKGKRYMYNGWVAQTLDPGIKQKIIKKVPCSYMKYDWLKNKSRNFCLDTKKCSLKFDKVNKTNDLCFSFGSGSRIYIYIREDLPKSNKEDKNNNKECPPGKVINPKTGRCIKDKSKKENNNKECPPGKVINPKTGRCIKDKSKKENNNKECPPGKVINPKTGRCIKDKSKKGD
jgi:hypothetical protein